MEGNLVEHQYLTILTIVTGKNCVLLSIQQKNGCLAASDLFHVFTQSISSIYSITRIKEYRCLKNGIHQNRQ